MNAHGCSRDHTQDNNRLAAWEPFRFDYDFALENIRFWTICTLRTTTDMKEDTNFPHTTFFHTTKQAKSAELLIQQYSTWGPRELKKITSANMLADLKSSPPFYCNNRVVMLRMKKCFLLKYKVKHSFNTAKLKCSTLSHKHTLSHRAGREQQEKGCPLEKGEFHVYLAV